ncbi:hypothetical protein POF50_002450 [Streptomyces sp. SL13]|jgi:hypothetical protein|uniref:SPOR domain-containing protein n=1 Tax=Streptantibioticus silvisoli TaxID=2705255 RepID=A0AA90K7F5_9ACTN|nr:hypothetical protein [Streptantibioticus silvisoli]MDI5961636.1 hypothetical protein [Streptantibioticus silvisoli]MDI5968217.1 hypothetical protein [Streptantibioticus silvisoli]
MGLFSGKPTGKAGEWYYCVKHHKVEEGPECAGRDRMGPYPSREAAANAMATVSERNDEWDAKD